MLLALTGPEWLEIIGVPIAFALGWWISTREGLWTRKGKEKGEDEEEG